MQAPFDFQKLFELSPNPYMLVDRELRYVTANAAYLRVTASRLENLVGRTIFEAFPHDPDDPNNASTRMLRDSFSRVLTERTLDTLALIPYRVPRQTDAGVVLEDRYWSATHTPLFDGRGEVAFILQHTMDVTELQQLKRAVREAEASLDGGPRTQLMSGVLARAQAVQEANRVLDDERRHLRRLFEQAPGFMCSLKGPEHVFELANRSYQQLVGHRDLLGKTVREALPEVAGQGFFELLDRVFKTGEPFVGHNMGLHLQREPGGPLVEAFLDFVYQPIIEVDGRVSGIFVQGHDMTAQKRAEDELARHRDHLEDLVRERTRALEESEAERRQAEAALLQAQKMEAVGKLTGGVAHDFNNLLQVVSGNLQLLQRDTVGDSRAQRRLETALGAVERGARLASQLLAFARRQPLAPTALNPGRLVRDMDDLLRRALGEDVEVETVIAGGLWNTSVDRNQLENVILNLAINARDAMDGRGKLTIEAGNAMLDDHYAMLHPEVTAGQYVLLAISDTGSGMSQEVMERAFEPFFTTKPEGRGTGLGLSMVYGFVKQSGGHVKIYSELGHGTSIKIYLPRTFQAAAQPAENGPGQVEGGTETILVVEDDAAVRATVVEVLTELGYRVLKAHDGQSALAVIQSGLPVDLLFTDVVMPGPVRSPELARLAKAHLPDLEVLFTSGYTENAIVHGGRLDPGVSLLSKPYRREDLARKIRALLRGREQRLAAKPYRALTPVPAEAPSKGALRILLVEDDADIRESASELMTDLGHTVLAVESAEAASEALAKETFDLLFTDVTLPGKSGVVLAREAVKRYPSLRIIIASGDSRAVAAEDGQALERVVLLPKPYDLNQMERALEQAAMDAVSAARTRPA
ncbi:sensory box histidine kinase/response regulator [Corallococcus coralloides DSM 2259]|uniref:histidine kinase n=1 Tax=Corallococcus coralloides (strain ATCC 25202 / DSM 2259 / NBRC 100086 / M2) TaxID=1144275 RepID=H8MUM4_CORCM|nr:response regulator [Corallococcus coralloides]AFE11233.1 sensory box histidine kinase/response regulator [Corallococcus coralloides DSM 2259]